MNQASELETAAETPKSESKVQKSKAKLWVNGRRSGANVAFRLEAMLNTCSFAGSHIFTELGMHETDDAA